MIVDGSRPFRDLPVLMAGGANRSRKTGARMPYPKGTPMNKFFVTMRDRKGMSAEKFGDANGTLRELTI